MTCSAYVITRRWYLLNGSHLGKVLEDATWTRELCRNNRHALIFPFLSFLSFHRRFPVGKEFSNLYCFFVHHNQHGGSYRSNSQCTPAAELCRLDQKVLQG